MKRTPIPRTPSKIGLEAQAIWNNLKVRERKKLPVEDVKIESITTWQSWIMKDGVKRIITGNDTGAFANSDFPFMVRYKGQNILMDGNHRVAAALLEGKKGKIKARVYTA